MFKSQEKSRGQEKGLSGRRPHAGISGRFRERHKGLGLPRAQQRRDVSTVSADSGRETETLHLPRPLIRSLGSGATLVQVNSHLLHHPSKPSSAHFRFPISVHALAGGWGVGETLQQDKTPALPVPFPAFPKLPWAAAPNRVPSPCSLHPSTRLPRASVTSFPSPPEFLCSFICKRTNG